MVVKYSQHQFRRLRGRSRSGAVLLMAMLVMAAITASTIGVATVIRSTLVQSGSLNDFIVASAAADSGLERGLGIIAVDRRQSSVPLATAVDHAEAASTLLTSSGASYAVSTIQGPDPISLPELVASQPYAFDILAVDQRWLFIQATCDQTTTCETILEVTWTITDHNGETYNYRRILSQSQYQNTSPVNAPTPVLDLALAFNSEGAPTNPEFPILGYRVRLRAVGGNLTAVLAKACSDSTCTPASEQAIAGRIKLDSTGQFGPPNALAQSVKNAFVLWQTPSTAVFNYVLFSESSIIP